MADHHDVLDLDHIDGELQHGEIIGVLGRREIGDVAVHEQFARIEIDDLVGRHAAVRTADPEIFRRLLPFEPPEEARIGGNFALRPGPVIGFQMIEHAVRGV